MAETDRAFLPGDILMKGLFSAVLIGAAAAVIGAFSIGESLMNFHVGGREVLDPLQHFSGNGLLLLVLVGKVVIDLSFSITGIMLLLMAEKVKWTGVASPAAGLIQMVLLICYLSFFWDPGWSQILEPSSPFFGPLLQLVLSFLQSFAFIIAGVRR